MKTNQELEEIADALFSDYTSPRSTHMPRAIKLLRSIELDAWREAREMVDKAYLTPGEKLRLMEQINRIIRQLQLK